MERARLLFTMLGERQVGDRRVLPGQAPFGLAVPDQKQARWHAAHGIAQEPRATRTLQEWRA
jgi:hypothetical protein